MGKTERHFYRCLHCLEVIALEIEPPRQQYPHCPVCGDPTLEWMGQQRHGHGLEKGYVDAPCDCRCTSARGPYCSCRCGGENHGTHLVVQKWESAGPAPKLPATINRPAALRRRSEYLDAAARIRQAIEPAKDDLESRKRRGVWIQPEEYRRLMEYRRALATLAEIAQAKSHSSRMKKLATLAGRLNIAPPEPVRPTVQTFNGTIEPPAAALGYKPAAGCLF